MRDRVGEPDRVSVSGWRGGPVTIPTWPGEVTVPSAPAKNTRSPGSGVLTCVSVAHWSSEVRAMLIPAEAYACMTKPEQS